MKDKEIKKKAEEFARANKSIIANKLTDISVHKPELVPISIFMAGSPGAGKTEFSKNLIEILQNTNLKAIRIDSDDLRGYIPGYTGNNSHLFQSAVSIIVDKIHDKVLKNKQTFILDGTLSKYERSVKNIERSINKSRTINLEKYLFFIFIKTLKLLGGLQKIAKKQKVEKY